MPEPTPADGPSIPITIITGFLGSGKTTLILSLLPQLPKNYKLALLKNEFGDLAVDSQLATAKSISGVTELLNGCICCNLVGQLSDALEKLRHEHNPDRIVIETSGSAFPATLAMEVNRLVEATRGAYALDGVLSVVDVENWNGYDDTSYTAKIQARYTDLIVLNKWEAAGERRIEEVEDRILDLEIEPPIPRTRSARGWVSKDIVFGLDANMAGKTEVEREDNEHKHDHQSEVEVLSVKMPALSGGQTGVDIEKLGRLLSTAQKDEIYRIKAVLYSTTPPKSSDAHAVPHADSGKCAVPGAVKYILNWAFGRWTFTMAPRTEVLVNGVGDAAIRMTIITARYESTKWKNNIEKGDYIALEGGSADGLTVDRVL
ncbi:CobW domain-containing protein [Pseudovirgaria hyperparasitica]|uniref:CobW domain-containing protein n=1 Tax=Pseudovirgaria hyperparasitica TaxID=470096 RepID=A0A6A6VST2_9PEZI|nr:CobW domain-containing protein [Pseudovirgaria hyperparasitica]KAF2752814.1 CobW domain-containing protein [Pseudovirgaria hyperparasitica]